MVEPKLASDAKSTLSGTLAQRNTHSVQLTRSALYRHTAPIEAVDIGATSARSTSKTQQAQTYGTTDRFPGFTPHTGDIVQAIPAEAWWQTCPFRG